MPWVSPSSHVDEAGLWWEEPNIYDKDINTRGRDSEGIYVCNYGSFLRLLLTAGIQCNKLRFMVYATNKASIDIDVLKDGVWTDVYYGDPGTGDWVEVEFPEGEVTEARIRFHEDSDPVHHDRYVYEFQFWQVEVPVGYQYSDGLVSVQVG